MARASSLQATQTVLGRRLWWLILGRATAAILLLLASALWNRRIAVTAIRGVTPIFLAVAGATALYAAARLLSRNFVVQARTQLFFDVLLITWLVWMTDDLRSPYTALYILLISVAGFFVGPRGAMITSVGSAAAFTSCAVIAFTGVGWHRALDAAPVSLATTVQLVGFSDVSFLIVGLLAARLAERQTRFDVQLAAATQSLANLRALHERIVE